MFTIYYNGMYIHGYCDKSNCRVTDETGKFVGITFKSILAAKQAITKARNAGVPASR